MLSTRASRTTRRVLACQERAVNEALMPKALDLAVEAYRIKRAVEQMVAAETERCARIAERYLPNLCAKQIAKEIRGEK